MERLWSPWRHAYVTRSGEDVGCVFCDALVHDDARDLLLVEGVTCYVILNLYPYNSGHLMVVPRRHVGTLAALERQEVVEMAEWVRRAEMALTEAYEPQGINVGMNLGRPAGAGVLDHLHVHLVPRWTGDTNFMSVVGSVRVLPEDLAQSARRLRPIFERLSAA
jgi:ATP adenylyltransferase